MQTEISNRDIPRRSITFDFDFDVGVVVNTLTNIKPSPSTQCVSLISYRTTAYVAIEYL